MKEGSVGWDKREMSERRKGKRKVLKGESKW